MVKIKKAIFGIGGIVTALTAGVAAENALAVKPDEEVGHKQGFYEKYVKRPQDFLCASLATIALSPVLAGTALAVRIKLGSPVLFTQDRPGRNEKIFKLYKFRTMTDKKDVEGNLLPDTDRITPFGTKLRSTSLDELPELINIIKGDMSIIGPRPLLVQYLPYYTKAERQRHSIRPGLTGLAQINGRNFVKWDERLAMDVEYTNNVSFKKDLEILIMTIVKVLKKEDVAVDTDAVETYLDKERAERNDNER